MVGRGDAPAIRCSGLRKTYPGRPPVEAVRGIDLEVSRGECFGVLGPNGAGKTTLIEMLEGLLRPTAGEIELLGMRWRTDADAIRQAIGVTLQETRLSDKLTVLETALLFRSFYRQGIEPDAAIAAVSLESKRHAWLRTLSGGQRQRLAVACALVGDPHVLFLDEPTTGLDPQSRRQLWEIIRDCRQRGRSILLTTHYMEEAERLCDRVAIVDQGRIIALGTPRELIATLAGEHVIEFSAAEGEPATAGGQRPESPAQAESQWRELLAGLGALRFDDDRVELQVGEPHTAVPELLARLASQGRVLTGLTIRAASLEDVFVKLTGRHLDREAGGNGEAEVGP